jgi:hypothetical protein
VIAAVEAAILNMICLTPNQSFLSRKIPEP